MAEGIKNKVLTEMEKRIYETPIQTMDRLYKEGKRLETQKLYHEYQTKKRGDKMSL